MNILLTGGTGFLGKNILESFSEKYNIIAPKHSELELNNEDEVKNFFSCHQIDVIIHAAGKPGHRNAKDPTNIFYANIGMLYNLLANSDKFKKLIILGSGGIYDMRYYTPKMKEDEFKKHIPIDEHGFFRYIAGKHTELMDNVVDLRLFGIFGKYEDYAIRFISNAICKAIFDLPITIKQNRKFDYLYIDDLMPILDYFIENKGKYNAYNITPNKSIELYTLAEKVLEISGKNLEIKINHPDEGLEYSGDNSRLKEEIKKIKFTHIDKAIKELYQWYMENKHMINKEVLLYDK